MISVVIPLYNKELSIKATLESVLAQRFTDYEVIVVNDGSTDNSANVVRDMIMNDVSLSKKIRLIDQPNSGVSAARNRGIEEAKGEYVTFLDADDLWTEEYLSTLDALIHDYPDAGLYCIGYWVINSPQMPDKKQIDAINKDVFRGRVENPWIEDMDIYIGSSCSSKARMQKVGMLDTRMTHGEDLDFCWRLILDGGMVRDNKCCAFYRLDGENRAMRRVPPLDKHIPYYIDKYAQARADNPVFRQFYDREMIYRLYPYLLSERYAKAAREIAQKFDYSQQKWSMRFRMRYPRLFYIKKRLSYLFYRTK